MARSTVPAGLVARLGKDTGEPLYVVLQRALIEAIERSEFEPGQLLPSSRSLAHHLGVSRNTVNSAYQELVGDGILDPLPRSGFVVNTDMRTRVHSSRDEAVKRVDWPGRMIGVNDPLPHVAKPEDWMDCPYPFVIGQPDVDQFPARAWMRAVRRAISPEHIGASVRDAIDGDDHLLVEQLCRTVLPARGIRATPEEILMTMGNQNGIYLLGEALIGPGSTVAVEEPGYPDLRHIFARRRATLLPLAVDDCGVTPPADPSGIDLLCVTPSHHYPTNATLPFARRQRLLDLAEEHNFVILEDDYDSEFRYRGRPTPALKGLDETGRVVYLGSFSKFLAPGIRLGYVVADPDLVTALRDRRRYMLRHPPGVIQRAMALMIESGDYTAAVARTRRALKAKWQTMVGAIESHLQFPIVTPTGGVSIWVEGDAWLDTVELADRARAEGVVVEPGHVCFLSEPRPRNHFRLGYAGVPTDDIEPGVETLAGVVARMKPG